MIAACSATTGKHRVVEVTTTLHTQTVSPQDEELLMVDRASRINFAVHSLSPGEQYEAFYVRWDGGGIHAVKFEYRQVNRPDQILSQTLTPSARQTCNFRVAGNEFLSGGSISAWRVTLLSNTDSCLAEKHSALW